MPNYQNGKIYKIVNDVDDEEYYGSTTQPLCKRWDGHKKEINGKIYKSKLYQKIREYGVEHFKIILVEEYPCNNVEQLTAKEAEWIRHYGKLNRIIPGRTKKQYREENKDKIAEYKKQYREENKDTIAEYKKQYREENKDKFLEYNKQYREENKDKIAEQRKQPYECPCGSVIRKDDKARHEKSKKHQAYLQSQEP